ncbi:hypothetical protein BKI52_32905 [marine bacterium AO1-C]|nr:hypothetical protein BKI52_32905 [marine bacterium AO1-C]
MTDEEHNFYDTLHKWTALVFTIASIFVGIWQFNKGQIATKELEMDKLAETDKIQRDEKIWLDKRKEYAKVGYAIGEILEVDPNNKLAMLKAAKKFRSLYFGASILIADEEVSIKMTSFYETFQNYVDDSQFSDYSELVKEGEKLHDFLNKRSLGLGNSKSEKKDTKKSKN